VDGTLTVEKKELTVTAPSPTITYGGSVPGLLPAYNSFQFVFPDTAIVIDTPPTCDTVNPLTGAHVEVNVRAVGSYTTRCSGGADDNYKFKYVDGTLRVIYRWDGFLQPINDTAHTGQYESTFKLGSTVPAKFQLKDVSGNVVPAAAAPKFSRSAWLGACDPTTQSETVDADPGFAGSDFRWDSTAPQYIYNWSTKGLKAGEYRIFASLDDGTKQWVDICLR
jgi:MBG domain (YGX type)